MGYKTFSQFQNVKNCLFHATLRPQQVKQLSLHLLLCPSSLSKMQGLALPSSIPFLNPFNGNTNLRFCPTLSTSPSLIQVENGFVHGVSCVGTSHFGSFTRISSSFVCLSQRFDSLKVMATSAPESVDEAPKSKALGTLQLGGMFALWYSLNIYFNIFNKQVHHLEI